MRIRKVGLAGAGTMGSGIAALAASAGIPVILLDVRGEDDVPDGPARQGVDRALKARPAAFMDADRASLIATGNIDDDLERLADCDLVIEAIVEKLEPKRALYERLEEILPPGTIVASNTSGIPMRALVEGRSESFRRHFLGMHFFNPPRYLHLLELIPAPDTLPAVIDTVRLFGDRVLGKGIVVANDVPGFIANRLGVFGMVLAIRMMEKHGLSIDEADLLTGELLGRSKSATFRTADLSGIDIIGHVTEGLAKATGEAFSLSPWVVDLIADGRHGEKTGAGFYRKVGKEIETLDWRTGEYGPRGKVAGPGLKELARLPTPERFAAIRDWPGPYGDFAREYLLRFSHYVLTTAPIVADDIASVDRAMEWGYAWELGPFRQMRLLGAGFLREGFERLGLDVPSTLSDGTALAEGDAGGFPGLRLHDAASARPAIRTDQATLWNVSGVGVLELHSKMNTLGATVLDMVGRSLDAVGSDGMLGLVIGSEDPRTFSAGADLSMVAELVKRGDWKALEDAVRMFQGLSMRIRESPFPVVAAPFGLALGGGAELSMHSHLVQAHAELYMGQVEVGVGLLPAGGGTKELLFRFTSELGRYPEADPFHAVRRAFELIAMGTMSTSALHARKLGFLRDSDRITMNRDRLLADAVQRVRDLAQDHVAPVPRTIVALGREAIGNLDYAAWAMREAGQITEFEVRLAREIAYVLSGGDGPPRRVTEWDILDLEREGFLRLLGTQQTKERIEAMLSTGKPLRN